MNASVQQVQLEKVRKEQGEEACVKLFAETASRNRMQALNLLKDDSLTYPCFFALLPEIEKRRMQLLLPAKQTVAAEVTKQILQREEYTPRRNYLQETTPVAREALNWMFSTGIKEEFPPESFQRVMDIVVSVLIQIYQQKQILKEAAEYIFARRRRGQNVHELIWAYFKSHDPQALRWVAEHLPQADAGEAEFICDLLGIEHAGTINTVKTHDTYMQWLENNSNTLTFNEENKQYTSRPVVCRMRLAGDEEAET